MRKSVIFIFLLVLMTGLTAYASTSYPPFSEDHYKESKKAISWADSVLNSMTLEQQIGQLIMIRAHSNKSLSYKKKVAEDIRQYDIGGVCFFQGGPLRQKQWVENYNSISDIPLLVALDAEWGAGMRLDSTYSYPFQMTLGAIQDNYLLTLMGQAIAEELKAVGVNMNFAPVMDVNNNPENPVINFRSFGEEPLQVYQKAMSYARGMQSKHVIACGKHFPGHGDTDKDSHHTLPVIASSAEEMENIHLLPFRKATSEGLGAIMTAHLHVPSLDSVNDRPSSLSPAILNDLLINKYNYNGLIITDALEMAGVRKGYTDGEIAVEALKAGNDILLMPAHLEKTIKAIKEAIENGVLSKEEIRKKVRKVLVYKYWIKSGGSEKLSKNDIKERLELKDHKDLIQKLYKEALTLIKNDSLLPLGNVTKTKIAVVSVGRKQQAHFLNEMKRFAKFDSYYISNSASLSEYRSLSGKLAQYDLVITGMHASSIFPRSNYGFSQASFDFTELVSQQTKNIVVLFGNPYALNALEKENNASAIVVAYQNNAFSQTAAVEGLFGATTMTGRLPVSIGEAYKAGFGINSDKTRLGETSPYFMNIDASQLKIIDSIAKDGIERGAYPGCQILIARHGEIFYNKTFGHHTYEQVRPVQKNDLYDLASVTKIAATTIAVMKLQDEKKLDIDQRLSHYLQALQKSDKKNIIIREMMAHQARLHPWIPFYRSTLKSGSPLKTIYKSEPDSIFSLEVADNMYIYPGYQDSILHEIMDSKLRYSKRYKYSDLGFYMLRYVIDEVTGKSMDQYVSETFYEPMGLFHTTYLPLHKFDRRSIVPTEDDRIFRGQLVHGYVHDPGAAMMGGISGHAGLFSNATDLAAIMQMLLNKGVYAGSRFLDSATVEEFTRRQFPLNHNRRGIGFDKPLPDHQKGGPTCRETSNASFGHSGFTGTYAWADPEYDLVYIFLSNRVYPDAANRKLISMDIRTKIQKVIYQAMNNES